MAPLSTLRPLKRAANFPATSTRAKRLQNNRGTPSQPIDVDASQHSLHEPPHRASPRKALAAARQTTEDDDTPFESQLLLSVPEDAIAPPEVDTTEAATASSVGGNDEDLDELEARMADDFEGINWAALPAYCKPLRTLKHKKSWIFQHGYRDAALKDIKRTFWVCKYCHLHRIAGSKVILEVTKSTTAAISHLGQRRIGHGFDRTGMVAPKTLPPGQRSLCFLNEQGLVVNQQVANEIGNFDVQAFRYAAVSWLVDNNHPLREFETPAFKQMIAHANPEAAEALWVSHRSVSTYVLRLYRCMEPQIVTALSEAASRIHISFDGWTTKGGKRGFFGVVAHFADAFGTIRDLPIALPQLTGAHTGQRIAEVVAITLREFGITIRQLGCFILDNAAANDRAIATLANEFDFVAQHRRLRCAPHTLNLVGQMIIFGLDEDAYNNSTDAHKEEAQYLRDWRIDGPLGVLVDIVNHIRTPQQYDLFYEAQRVVNSLPHSNRSTFLEPVRPVVTRWNSYYDTFVRAVELKDAIDYYANTHIERVYRDDLYADNKGNRLADVPRWMRSTGLNAADWAVVTEYIEVLRPLKEATMSLEARGKAGTFDALYEVIPTSEAILKAYETAIESYGSVDYNANEAPEDHLIINLQAAWKKLSVYYSKLDDSPMYYAAVCLHPYYKTYCQNSWRDQPDWIANNEVGLQQLWAASKPHIPHTQRLKAPRPSSIRDAIAALVNAEPTHDGDSNIQTIDQLERWRRFEPAWTTSQYASGAKPIEYWVGMRSKYPELAAFAIDLMTIPASSCDCERMFSELGDILEPRRRKISSNLLAAVQCVKSWRAEGYTTPSRAALEAFSDDEIAKIYELDKCEQRVE